MSQSWESTAALRVHRIATSSGEAWSMAVFALDRGHARAGCFLICGPLRGWTVDHHRAFFAPCMAPTLKG